MKDYSSSNVGSPDYSHIHWVSNLEAWLELSRTFRNPAEPHSDRHCAWQIQNSFPYLFTPGAGADRFHLFADNPFMLSAQFPSYEVAGDGYGCRMMATPAVTANDLTSSARARHPRDNFTSLGIAGNLFRLSFDAHDPVGRLLGPILRGQNPFQGYCLSHDSLLRLSAFLRGMRNFI